MSRRFLYSRGFLCSVMCCFLLFAIASINSCDASSPIEAPIGSLQSPLRMPQIIKNRPTCDEAMKVVEDFIDFWKPGQEDVQNERLILLEQKRKELQQEIIPSTMLEEVPLALSPSLHIKSFGKKFVDDNLKIPLRSTGTTIAGLVLEESGIVLLGADTRATDDRIVADKLCSKIHMLSKDIYACGAGTSGDLEATTRQVRYAMKLDDLKQSTIGNHHGDAMIKDITIHRVAKLLKDSLYKNHGKLGVNLILGGQGILVALHPHGSIEVVPYTALGSGGLAAMAVLEGRYHSKLSLNEAKLLISHAIKAGIDNDLGSGSQVDLCIIYPTGEVEYTRAAVPEVQIPMERTKIKPQDDLAGVNGFGNVIFNEQSRRTLMTRPIPRTNDEDEWNSLLGV